MNALAPRTVSLVLAVLCLALGLAACGSDNNTSTTSTGGSSTSAATPAATTPAAKKIKVAMVTDIGGLNDRSFNASAYKGLQEAKAQLGADIRVLTSSSNADYVPNLSTLARQKYDLIIAVGFLMADATAKVAKAFPNVNFAIIDSSQALMKGKPANVEGLLFKEQESGYLAGYMAGLYLKDKGGKQVASTVGGQKIPPVDHYIAGFKAGLTAADPKAKELNAYSQDFVDQAKCKEIALNQIQQGSQVVFQVAGGCGLGALDAAKEKKVQGIGVDVDQAYIGDQVMTSAVKKIDQAVLDTVKAVQDGSWKAGDKLFNLTNDGTGIGKTNSVGAKYQSQVDKIQSQIKDGSISDIPDTVK
jgi:basic membrane protein A and related proteins